MYCIDMCSGFLVLFTVFLIGEVCVSYSSVCKAASLATCVHSTLNLFVNKCTCVLGHASSWNSSSHLDSCQL